MMTVRVTCGVAGMALLLGVTVCGAKQRSAEGAESARTALRGGLGDAPSDASRAGSDEQFARVVVCAGSKDALAVSKDERHLYRFDGFYGSWEELALTTLPGKPSAAARVLDVACNTNAAKMSEEWSIVGQRDGAPAGVYRFYRTSGLSYEWQSVVGAPRAKGNELDKMTYAQ